MIHLHHHSMYSVLDGYGSPEQIIAKCKELNFPAIAITDHASVDGLIKFQKEAKKNDIHLIYGSELYIVPNLYDKQKGERRNHLTVWVKNQQGWHNLLKMLTLANTEGFYYRPRIDPNLLLTHCEGLAIGSACASTWIKESWGEQLLQDLIEKGADVFIELMPFDDDEQRKVNKIGLDLAEKYGIPTIATNDGHYIEDDDAIVQEVMLAIQSRAFWDDPKRWKFGIDGLYLRTEQEMIEAFKVQGLLTRRQMQTAIKNTQLVFDLCKDFEIQQQEVELPRIKNIPSEVTDEEFLQQLVQKGWELKIKNKNLDEQVYRQRLEEELEVIHGKGFERYFLIVWEMVEWAENNNIMVGPGRGSAGGSLVCYLLGITEVDPIKYGMLFSRFIDRERADLPDIDIDYSDKDRIRQHLDETYGKNNVAGISTFSFMKGRSAIRDVCRVFKVPYDLSDEVAKSVDDTDKVESIEHTEAGRRFIYEYPLQYEIAKKLDGQIRGRGQHACGIVISQDDLTVGDRTALVTNKQDSQDYITNWDKDDLEFCGLMKADVLGLSELQVLKKAQTLVQQKTGETLDYNKIDLEDRRCLRQFTRGNTTGCFQVGTKGLQEYCQKLRIDNFMMLSHATALYRPGPLSSGMAEDFIERKNGRQDWQLIHKELEPYLGFTYGLIVYQEQIMQIVAEIAGLGWGVANRIRKVISKSQGYDVMKEYEDSFVEGCLKVGVLNKREALDMFDDFVKFGAYGFNIAHSVEYSHITFWDMYLKVYHPVEFFCASLTYCMDNARQALIDDAWDNGVEIRSPKIGKSLATEWNIVNGILYAPLTMIKGIGEKTALRIEKANEPEPVVEQKDVVEQVGFFVKTKKRPVAKKVPAMARYKQTLVEIGAYEDEQLTKQRSRELYKYFGVYLRR